MLHYFKFRQDLFAPQPAREIYVKPGAGRGWPQECPPLRAACAFGFDVLANFDVTFIRGRGGWRVEPDVVIESDFGYAGSAESEGKPISQQYAWGWEKGQTLPHVISDNVYEIIKNQFKISTYLFLKTDADESLLMTGIPNLIRPWQTLTALIDTDLYPASYPWHTVIELDPKLKRIHLHKGEPLCRLIPVRRETYRAKPMSQTGFSEFFDAGQKWLKKHGTVLADRTVDIRRAYAKVQKKAGFISHG